MEEIQKLLEEKMKQRSELNMEIFNLQESLRLLKARIE
jgi:hypothetical protein